MSKLQFRGYGNATLSAEDLGSPELPCVLLLHGAAQTRNVWNNFARSLVRAGRYVISLDFRGHGESGCSTRSLYDFDVFVEDLRCVLNQLISPPVVVASLQAGWVATSALNNCGSDLAAGLVLVDTPLTAKERRASMDKYRQRVERLQPSPCCNPYALAGFEPAKDVAIMVESGTGISLPLLFIRGALGDIVQRESVQRFLSATRNAELADIEDTSYMGNEERIDYFNTVLLDFLERRIPRPAK